eukprot:505808_1
MSQNQWACEKCTLLQNPSNNQCILCHNPRQKHKMKHQKVKTSNYQPQYIKKNVQSIVEEKDIEEEINDGYKYAKHTHTLLASSPKIKRSKQNDSDKSNPKDEIMKKLTPVTISEETDKIQKCIGQVKISYDGTDTYYHGTGTIYKQLNSKYYLMITCAHNLVDFNERNNKKEYAKNIFYLPNGVQDQDTRLVCINWIAHER